MSLPTFSAQGELFSTAGLAAGLFAETDRYRLFAKLVYPALVAMRPALEKCYCPDNGREALEPVVMMETSILQYIDGVWAVLGFLRLFAAISPYSILRTPLSYQDLAKIRIFPLRI
jgi:hypothetical protein